ncbi:hypothetical protein Rs2_49424 [Raphanus sativus]|nr:hypothetical protein Rs2_49424 [Raphanus sativus]
MSVTRVFLSQTLSFSQCLSPKQIKPFPNRPSTVSSPNRKNQSLKTLEPASDDLDEIDRNPLKPNAIHRKPPRFLLSIIRITFFFRRQASFHPLVTSSITILGVRMTSRGKRGKRQNKKQNNSTREKVQEHNPAPVADEELSGGNETQTENHSATSQECQPLPPDELYFKNTEFTKSCKIQSKCSVSGTVDLLKKLTPEDESPELEWFKNHPQFCHIFHMPNEPNLRLLGMWSLLLRTIPLHEGEDTAWFAVNGVPLRYSMREHALISGLDCRDYPPNYKKLGSFAFVDRHFGSHKEITMESVREKLLSMSACGDRLRMAVLYFLGTVIRAKARYNAPFDSFILRVVNDVEICKTFPWGRLTFDDAIGSINYVMKKLKGEPKKNVNFPGFIVPLEILAFECIPALNARFRERVAGCFSSCPRMCKKRFQSNSMKGYPLQDLYDTLGHTTVIDSVLVPTVDEEPLMARICEGEPDYENEEGVSNLWSTWLTIKEKPIFWQGLYELDVAAREFPQKKDKGKGKVNEEASSSVHGLEDVLKGFEERMMASLSEVIVKVETMDKRLGVVEKSHVILKRRSKRMKAMEKRLDAIERTQDGLKLKARKQKTLEERLDGIEKEMKKQEKEKENDDGFEYQTMDHGWNDGRYDSNLVEPTAEKASEEEAQKEDKSSEKEKEPEAEAEAQAEEAQKEDKGSEEEKEPEHEAEPEEDKEGEGLTHEEKETEQAETENKDKGCEEEKQPEEEQEARVETEQEIETNKEAEIEEKEAEKQPMETPTPPRGRTKAAARKPSGNWKSPRKRLVLTCDEEKQEEWLLSLCKSYGEPAEGTSAVDEGAPAVDKGADKETDELDVNEEAPVVDEGAPVVDEGADKETDELDVDEEAPVVDEGAPVVGAEDYEGLPARIGVKHRPKARGRPRKPTDPKKFTMPEETRTPEQPRTRIRSQWISSPFTEADTDEIEGRKKKPRTEA